ncbi:MAG: DUF3857 and transglutaminase domain-containing protein [Rhizomicrobium sp.]
MHRLLAALFVLVAAVLEASAAFAAPVTPPFEVVKNHVEIEVQPDGAYVESREVVYRLLTEQGARALREMQLGFTRSYQSYMIPAAYTLKKDGTRIDVPRDSMLLGYGASNSPGFQDTQTLTVVFPNAEVGDEVAITTLFRQIRPWFGQSYTEEFLYSSEIPAHDVVVALTAPADMTFQIDAAGLTALPDETLGGKTRRVWHFRNDTPTAPESEAVDAYDRSTKLVISTFKDYRAFAGTYSEMLKDRAEVTPEIRTLADTLTQGLKGDREQARALYEWVALHIAYVNIVLGAGGFVPHRAADVLENKYGDCKDHVILLEALLAAKGIDSTPVLISAEDRFTLSPSPSPYVFNHMITYVPELHLYLDSTARYAPFGVLPFSDAGKPVIHVDGGETARTPPAGAANASIRSVETIAIASDGSVSGETRVTATGAPAVDLRGLVDSIKTTGEVNYFRQIMGPGVDATLDAGNVGGLDPVYRFSAHYQEAGALNIPGPGTIPYHVVYKPFAFTSLIAGGLPPTRTQPYICMSMAAEEDLTIRLPPEVHILALPHSETLSAEGVDLAMTFSHPDPATIRAELRARIDHPTSSCTPAYYARVRGALARMTSALRSEILYN